MLFLVGPASVSIDFYFVLNSFFLRAKVANWNGEGLSCIFFFSRDGFRPGFFQQRLGDKLVDFGFGGGGKRNETW